MYVLYIIFTTNTNIQQYFIKALDAKVSRWIREANEAAYSQNREVLQTHSVTVDPLKPIIKCANTCAWPSSCALLYSFVNSRHKSLHILDVRKIVKQFCISSFDAKPETCRGTSNICSTFPTTTARSSAPICCLRSGSCTMLGSITCIRRKHSMFVGGNLESICSKQCT